MYRTIHLKTRGGGSGVGGSTAAGETGGGVMEEIQGGEAEGDGLHAGAIKVEAYDGSNQSVVCLESVRGNAVVLQCSQCSANPFHRTFVEKTKFMHKCPQCSCNIVVP